MNAQIKVLSGGLSTTVQDLGRTGQYSIGMPPSGAMDQFSFRVANLLVGNDENDAALEATYIGPTLEFTDNRTIAITGGDAGAKLNGEPIEMWVAVSVAAGDVLSFGVITTGTRPYIAISGGVDVPLYLGSRSTYTLIGLGGHEGGPLTDGDTLPLGEAREGRADARVPAELIPQFTSDFEVRAVIGLCSYRLTDAGISSFLETPWKITKDADRVGYRLRGGTLDFVEREQPFGAGSDPANVVDLGYPLGSVQIPGGNEPIVLLGDAVTGGGYTTIATVISVDRDLFGQAKTGDTIRFKSVGIEEALAARNSRTDTLNKIRQAVEQ